MVVDAKKGEGAFDAEIDPVMKRGGVALRAKAHARGGWGGRLFIFSRRFRGEGGRGKKTIASLRTLYYVRGVGGGIWSGFRKGKKTLACRTGKREGKIKI